MNKALKLQIVHISRKAQKLFCFFYGQGLGFLKKMGEVSEPSPVAPVHKLLNLC